MGRIAALQADTPIDPGTDLAEAIARLRAPAIPAAEYTDFDTLVRDLLLQVRDTVLPRHVSLNGPEQEICSLTLAGRGLVAFDFPHARHDAQPERTPAGPEPIARRFLQILQASFPRNGACRLQVTGPAPLGAGVRPRCTAEQLASAHRGVPPRSPTESFLAGLQPHARAWLRVARDGSRTGQSGSPPDQALLDAFAAHLLPTADSGQITGPTCVLFPCAGDGMVAWITDRTTRGLLLLDRATQDQVLRCWAGCIPAASPHIPG